MLRPHTPLSARFTLRLAQGSVSTLAGSTSQMVSSYRHIPVPRAPLPDGRCYLRSARCREPHVSRRYPAFVAPTGSCARPNPSHRLWLLPRVAESLQVAASPCWELGPSRRYLRNPCPGAWTRTPQCPFGALTRFFPKGIGLTSVGTGSAHQTHPQCNFNDGRISGLQSFANVQAPILARPPDCTHRCGFNPQGGRAVYTTHISVGYLPRAVVSLRA